MPETAESTAGVLDVLNVGHGHLTFKFDKNKTDEVEKAKKVVSDMLRRGYMIFVKVGGEQVRVRQFDAEHEEYILEEPDEVPAAAEAPVELRVKKAPRRVAMRQARATGIGPTAGG